jgi:DNA-directed RNA polymerase specialized sigma24 family protein
MQHRADVERAQRVAQADPSAFEQLLADTVDRVYAFALGRSPTAEAAERVSERALERVFRDLQHYEGSVSLSAWMLAIVKRELRREASLARPPVSSHAISPPAGSAG